MSDNSIFQWDPDFTHVHDWLNVEANDRNVIALSLDFDRLLLAYDVLKARITLVNAELSNLRDSLEQDWIDYDSAQPPQDPTASMVYAERQRMLRDYVTYVTKIRAHLAGGTP